MNFFVRYLQNNKDILILWILITLLGGYIVHYGVQKLGKTSLSRTEVDIIVKKINIKGQRSWPLRPKLKKNNYLAHVNLLKKFSYYEDFLKRDIFHSYVTDAQVDDTVINPYVLLGVIKVEVPLIWKGIFQKKGSKELRAQVNIEKDTYFLKKGDKILKYAIVEVTPYFVEVRKEGASMSVRLEKDIVALEEGIKAKIYNKENGETFAVAKDQFVEGWNVRSIMNGEVRMHKGGVTILVKEGEKS
jgi:hypothetical protein